MNTEISNVMTPQQRAILEECLLDHIATRTPPAYPCVCGGHKASERNILCRDCWRKLPKAMTKGFQKIEILYPRGSNRYQWAADQILRIATQNLETHENEDNSHYL